ncbi:MAG: ABC transporter ATP-binding protein [Anaerolineaceae bacterium]|jgi:ABC-type Fe3+/spermidine/putrescine transport system ATPase subunit|nr:ABC transporter ATP-binding protein [Anaerolineaceae bacterium]
MSILALTSIAKSYGDKPLLQNISFTLGEGETVCLLGASGSGKSTLLRMIAGLETPDLGTIFFDDFDLASTPPHLRDFGLVFQDYALFPHLSVKDNVAFGLKIRRVGQAEISERTANSLKLVNLEGFEQRNVNDLSGGEQQRVALARALTIRPRLLMFDEPLGALDKTLREGLLNELRSILRRTKIPAIYVTHDQEEAFAIADRVLILHEGSIICEGTPAEVWANPKSAYVAKFLGLGNVIDGVVKWKMQNNEWKVESGIGEFVVQCKHKHSKGEEVCLLARPFVEQSNRWPSRRRASIRLERQKFPAAVSRPEGCDQNTIHGKVADVIFQQDKYKITLDNGLYVYLKDAPKVGRKISVKVKVECLG